MINLIKRYQTIASDVISSLPIVVLMPYGACNCRCVMCDIWKDNFKAKQLNIEKIDELLLSFQKLNTKWITLSGGEALLHPHIESICKHIKLAGFKLSILSTGITVSKQVQMLVNYTDELILSLDGNEVIHNQIRNIPKAFQLLKAGVQSIYDLNPNYRISSRTVIQKQNYKYWIEIIETGLALGIKQMSFLPADVSSEAFNHVQVSDSMLPSQIMLSANECEELALIVEQIISNYSSFFRTHFIAESPDKLRKIVRYYQAMAKVSAQFPQKNCNAPWVSTVIEADGNVRHCFFLGIIGNVNQAPLEQILNKAEATNFRKRLNTQLNVTCEKCVCYLHLKPHKLTF